MLTKMKQAAIESAMFVTATPTKALLFATNIDKAKRDNKENTMQTTILSPQSHFVTSNEQISTQVENDTVILNLETGKYYSLEGVGSFVWQAINKGQSLADIERSISHSYAVSTEVIKTDIYAFVHSLLNAGLIKTHVKTHA